MKEFYKLAMPSGWDFYTGKTINYREAIGHYVVVPKIGKRILCSDMVLHACPNPNDCFVGAKIPCSAYTVSGKPLVNDGQKFGFKRLKVLKEIPQNELDTLFGWKYLEACNPINPFKISPPKVTDEQLALLRNWASVWDSVGAYIGSLFPNINKWKYITHKHGEYPFQSAVDLWHVGLVPSFDGNTWRVHGGEKGEILYSFKEKAKP